MIELDQGHAIACCFAPIVGHPLDLADRSAPNLSHLTFIKIERQGGATSADREREHGVRLVVVPNAKRQSPHAVGHFRLTFEHALLSQQGGDQIYVPILGSLVSWFLL